MAVGPWIFTNAARQKVLDGTFVIGTGPWKCALFTSASNISAASTAYASITNELANANGYTTGGLSVSFSMTGTTDVDVVFASNPAWTATGGNLVKRFAGVYKTAGDLFMYCLLDTTPADVTTVNGSVFLLAPASPNPLFD